MTSRPQTERDLIIALFHRIGEQLELTEEWKKLPNAERSVMAGDFYNIIIGYSNQQSDKMLDEVLKEINRAAPEMEGKKLFITVLALCEKIDRLRKAVSRG